MTPNRPATDLPPHLPQERPATALVLGATGGIGGEVARQLLAAGWVVRGLRRRPLAAGAPAEGIAWQVGDAMDAEAVRRAAAGCAVIVHAVNPPGYRGWAEQVLPMADNTVAAARAVGATVLLPGTVYNYGADAGTLVAEDAPQRPATRKGAIRVALEQRLQQFSAEGGRVIIVRAGDFFGARAGNSWFAQGLVKSGRPVRRIASPGDAGVGHQWAYLPDVAATMVALLSRRSRLPAFARYNVAGHWDADGRGMAQAIARAVVQAGGPAPRIGGFPWWLLRLASPLVTTFREMQEMRWLWRRPLQLDGRALAAELGAEPHTPLDEAVRTTLAGLGCLPAPAAPGIPIAEPGRSAG